MAPPRQKDQTGRVLPEQHAQRETMMAKPGCQTVPTKPQAAILSAEVYQFVISCGKLVALRQLASPHIKNGPNKTFGPGIIAKGERRDR